MPQQSVKSPRTGYPPSPCNRVCILNELRICTGCSRTMDEIVAWSSMSAAEQWQIVARVTEL